MKTIRRSALVMLLSSLSGIAVATGFVYLSGRGPDANTSRMEVHASQAYGGYPSLEALALDADAVVIARVQDYELRSVNEVIVLTDSRMLVSRVMKGSLSRAM